MPEQDRPLWATALYAGLRRGELMALRWEDVDLAAGLIRVERSYDPRSGSFVVPKSQAGRRKVPIAAGLRDLLIEYRLRSPWKSGLIFGRTETTPFSPSWVAERAARAWDGQKLPKVTLHESRHTYASLMIAAGVNAKALSTYMGHSSVMITLDRYGHLFPGNEAEAASLFNAFLAMSDTRARLAQIEGSD